MGIGILAASVLGLSPLDADASRIECYATVGEPLCELNFVPSGLACCDVSVGSGEEAPYSELIDVHCTARFAEGTVFDNSYKCARPLTMCIGVGKVTAIFLPMQLFYMILILSVSTADTENEGSRHSFGSK